LSYYNTTKNEKIKYGIGASNYYGFERNATNIVYNHYEPNANSETTYAMADTTNHYYKGEYSKRIYYGFEGLFSIKSIIGTTTLHGEYVAGQQPGSAGSSRSPQVATNGATYMRDVMALTLCLYNIF
jgi:hypothetical protein